MLNNLHVWVFVKWEPYIYKQQWWCLSVWAVSGRFFQSLPVPCGASPYVTSPYVTDSREKRNQGQSDYLRQKIWQTRKKIFRPWTEQNQFFFSFVLTKTTFFFFQLMSVPIKGMDEMFIRLDDRTNFGETFFLLATIRPD